MLQWNARYFYSRNTWKKKISKYIGKYVGSLELFDINLVFLSIKGEAYMINLDE